jgi:multiple sugar transport system substrate-binding protein
MSIRRLSWRRTGRTTLAVSAATALLVGMAACGGDDDEAAAPCTEAEGTEDEQVALRFTFWGADSRADLTEQVIDLFEAENPDIAVNAEYADWEGYWTDRTTEAAGGGLPDLVQMDYAYISQFDGNQLLADLQPCVDSGALTVDTLRPGFVETGTVDGRLLGVPLGGNTLATFYRPDILADLGIDPPQPGWTWDDYHAMITEISEAGVADQFWGGGDYTNQYHFMDMWLRQNDGSFYTDDGELGFDEATLTDWWGRTADLREQGVLLPPDVATELTPLTGLGAGVIASEIGWDNFMGRYYGEGPDNEYAIGPVPTDTGSTGQYLKPSMLLSVSAHSTHPNEAAQFLDFFVNDPAAAAILGIDRGIPASQAAFDAIELGEIEQQIVDYEASVFDELTAPPPPPPPGAGSVEAAFLTINEELNYGEITLEDAVARFFTEAQTTLDENRID